MIKYFRFLLLAGAVGEIASIAIAGRWVGVLAVLFLIAAGGIVGATVIRTAGLGMADAMRRTYRKQDAGPDPAIGEVLKLAAGVLLIIPGFLSDVIAIVLLVPPVRRWLSSKITDRLAIFAPKQRERSAAGPIIEGEAVEIEGDVERRPNSPWTQ